MKMNDAMSECCVRLGLGNKGELERNVRERYRETREFELSFFWNPIMCGMVHDNTYK